jgi:hypothetical protein
VEDLVAATAYFELFLRSVSDPGLLYSFVHFLLEDKYDGERILDSLIQRINTKSRVNEFIYFIGNYGIIMMDIYKILPYIVISLLLLLLLLLITGLVVRHS